MKNEIGTTKGQPLWLTIMRMPKWVFRGPNACEASNHGPLRLVSETGLKGSFGESCRSGPLDWRFPPNLLVRIFIGILFCIPLNAWAIFPHPVERQVKEALERGQESARQHQPPNLLYWPFGPLEGFHPHGFLMTKLSGLAVMSSHFALRGEQPSPRDIQRVLNEDELQVVVIVFGNSPRFATDSYLLLKQEDRVIKPDWIRFDARAEPINQDQGKAVFRAKIVGGFSYGTFDPELPTSLMVFPGSGGQIMFSLNFSEIP